MARTYIQAADAALPTVASGGSPVIDSTSWRLGSYITAVVLIYGALERFLDETLVATAQIFNALVPTYADLPQVVQDNHLALTVQVMRSLDDPRWADLTARDLSERLAGCLGGAADYALNAHVFKERTGNYRHPKVRESFRRLNVGLPEEVTTQAVHALLTNELSGKYARMSTLLEDLVQRRNEAAHGLEVQDVLDAATLESIAGAVEAYAHGIRSHVVNAICQTCITTRPAEISSLGAVSRTWKDPGGVRSICEITQGAGVPSRVGDVVMVGHPPAQRVATVTSIGWGKRRLKSARAVSGRKIALGLGRRVTQHEVLRVVIGLSAEQIAPFAGW